MANICAASTSAHTRRAKPHSSLQLPSGIFIKLLYVLFVGFLAWAYQAIQPPPPKICGSADGPLVTAPRIKLRDGRHLAYKEHGVLKDTAKYKIIYVHGFDSCRDYTVVANKLSPNIFEEMGVYILSFDRPGYGESDPDPRRTVKSIALNIEELADQLGLGSRFHVIGYSMGGQVIWSCLKYIPHRLASATLLAPVVNYWWPGFPANSSKEAFKQNLRQDQWTLRVAHYAPWLIYWWNTQKWFPAFTVLTRSHDILSPPDREIVFKPPEKSRQGWSYTKVKPQVKQQGVYESLHRDLMIGFGTWEFDPMELENPFPNNEGIVHLWHGDQDWMIPVSLERYIVQRLPWIQYHEIADAGHFFPYAPGMSDAIIKALLITKN